MSRSWNKTAREVANVKHSVQAEGRSTENTSYRQSSLGLSARTVSWQGAGEVLLGIFGKTLSNAFEFCSQHIIKRQQQAVPPGSKQNGLRNGRPRLPGKTPSAKEQTPSCLFPETQPRKSVTGFGGIPSLAACEETAQSPPLQTGTCLL